MRLIETASSPDSLKLREFVGTQIPRYAILSHRWSDDEVLYQDVLNNTYVARNAFTKVAGATNLALEEGFDYLWIDTCCIDKTSSAELGEAINSMFEWYSRAGICYVYLDDVDYEAKSAHLNDKDFHTTADRMQDAFAQSRWFTRGWTLQELVAPRQVAFFSRQWQYLGKIDKTSSPSQALLLKTVSIASRVAISVLTGTVDLYSVSIAARMSWMAGRETTRAEDMAYCLLGLFGVNMPLLYGEGDRAFARLQEEIMKSTDDNSIFAWLQADGAGRHELHGLLALSPRNFASARSIERNLTMTDSNRELSPYLMTNKGLQIELPLKKLVGDIYVAILNCDYGDQEGWVAMYLKRLAPQSNQFARIFADQLTSVHWREHGNPETFFVRQENAGFSWTQVKQRAPRTTYWVALDGISIASGRFSANYDERKVEPQNLVRVWSLAPDDRTSSYVYMPPGGLKAKAYKLNNAANSVAVLIGSDVLRTQLILILGPMTATFFGYKVLHADEHYLNRLAARDPTLLDQLMEEKQLQLPWEQTVIGSHTVQVQILDVELVTLRPEGSTLSSATNRVGPPRLRPPLLRSNAHDSSFYGSRREEIHYEKHFKLRLIVNDGQSHS